MFHGNRVSGYHGEQVRHRLAKFSRRLLTALVVASLLTGYTVSIGPTSAMAATCSRGQTPSTLDVYSYGGGQYGLWGRAYVTDPAAKAGCMIRVCVASGKNGQWPSTGCANSVVDASEHWYESWRVVVICKMELPGIRHRSLSFWYPDGVRTMGPDIDLCPQ